MLREIIIYTLYSSLTEAIDTDYIEKAKETDHELDFTQIFRYSRMTTIIALYNESVFTHIEPDLANESYLLACLSSAVSVVDLNKGTAWAIAGLPARQGYKEGIGTEAEFHTIVSLAQINKTMLIISDQYNNCLRWIDRSTHQTSPFAGTCGDDRLKGDTGKQPVTDLIFTQPGALLYNDTSKVLYAADYDEVLRINMTTNTAQRHFKSSKVLSGLTSVGSRLLASYSKGVLQIETVTGIETLLTGINAGHDDHHVDVDNLNETVFDKLADIQLLYQNIYVLAEYGTHQIRGIDLKR